MAGRTSPEVLRDERCQRETGLRHAELVALIAVVTAYALDQQPTTGKEVAALVDQVDEHTSGPTAASWLLQLTRKGWLRVARWRGNTALYEPTRLALQKCDEWIGRMESDAAE